MSQLQERIVQYRKMATDDPDNELGHFQLGKLLLEAGQYEEAVRPLRRTLELSPQFSKVYQLLGECLMKQAGQVLTEGYAVADERGDNVPRDEMARLLTQLGAPIPEVKKKTAATGSEDGFRCRRPGCPAGSHAQRLAAAPMNDALGRRIQQEICADCWNDWLRNQSIKVINEGRLDLSTERDQASYDQVMMQFLGFE